MPITVRVFRLGTLFLSEFSVNPHTAFERDKLAPSNARVFDYWQSLRLGDGLPERQAFDPRVLKDLLPTICLFRVKPGEGVMCRVAGGAISRGLGMELTGRDYIACSSAHYRRDRLARFARHVKGAFSHAFREIVLESGEEFLCEELIVPFAGGNADNSQDVLYRLEWKPPHRSARVASIARTLGPPLRMECFTL